MATLVNGLPEKMRFPANKVLETLESVFTSQLSAVAVKGSVVRGDFIPYFSDLDVHVFLRETSLVQGQAPRAEAVIQLQEVVGQIELENFQLSSIQLTFNNGDRRPKSWIATPPEVCKVLYGSLPSYDLDSDSWQDDALSTLEQLEREIVYELKSTPDKSNDGLARIVRRQGVFLKGGAYSLAGLLMKDIRRAQLLPYWKLDDYLFTETQRGVDLQQFHDHARQWRETRNNPTLLRRMFVIGTAQLQALASFRTRAIPE